MYLQAIINDLHVPYHDPRVVDSFGGFCEEVQPHEIHFVGDIWDFRSASLKFRDTPKDLRVTTLQYEVKLGQTLLSRFRDRFPRAKLFFYGGNHEDRLARLINNNAQALAGLVSLEKFIPPGFKYFPYGEVNRCGGLSITHGDIVRSQSGATARAMLEKYGTNILFGHTHRMGSVCRTDGGRSITAWENGCACLLVQPYTVGPTNWQQGWSLVENDGKRKFRVQQVPFTGGYVLGGCFHEAKQVKDRISRGLGGAHQ